MNFNIDASKANQRVLEKLDKLIAIYQEQKSATDTITLSRNVYEALQRNILHKTDGKQSLKTHGDRGYKLVCG